MSDLSKLLTAEPCVLTDGSLIADVSNSQPTGSEAGLIVREAQSGQQTAALSRSVVLASDSAPLVVTFQSPNTYGAATLVSAGLTISSGATYSIAYLWHPASVAKTYLLQRVGVTINSGSAATGTIRVTRITAEAASPGGSSITPLAYNGASPASSAVVRCGATGAPTRAVTDIFARNYVSNSAVQSVMDSPIDVGCPACRSGVAEGWEVRLISDGANLTGIRLAVELVWVEQ